ncbi:MAG: 50S ribosome-binding GTPase [Candidatus Thorarchaeota archaeon]|nr:50S ribosome-binding GTPase [Candidatus Thorarchaeota archaeon]
MKIRVALIGNPNVGKSVIFNSLTGLKQHTGNWPGKTVEKKEGYYTFDDYEFEVVDLPGVYSLSAVSEDERVARQFIVDHRPDVVVDILNASQLERNLYLTLLLIELQVNLVVVLNMYDVVNARGDRINLEALSQKLGAPVIATTATKKEGIEELKEAIVRATPMHVLENSRAESKMPANEHLPGDINGNDHLHYHPRFHHHGEYERLRPPAIKYGPEIESKLKDIVSIIEQDKELLERFPPRWLALRLLERDTEILELVIDLDLKRRVLEVTL